LILNQGQYKYYKKYIGKKVKVVGQLMHSTTGHHKTDVLIVVNKITLF